MLEGDEHDPFIRDSRAVVEAILDFVNGRPIAPARRPRQPGSGLTRRELEVLRLVTSGASNAETASTLLIAVKTVERHLTNI